MSDFETILSESNTPLNTSKSDNSNDDDGIGEAIPPSVFSSALNMSVKDLLTAMQFMTKFKQDIRDLEEISEEHELKREDGESK